ncbi:hypothetical protein [Kribbella sp. NPDC023855]|uniref:hypothetical protein n=1 Tax=Kribbella sp. NPDC023855 TaxID=3154698 RepID=UPI0033F3B69A
MTEDLAINLLAAVIAFVAGWTLRTLYKYLRDVRPAVRMWRAAAGGDFSIVVADGPLSEKNRPTIHPAEFAAATELSGYLAQSLRINVTRVRASINFPLDEALEGNLILIGGPIHNQVHRLMLERLELPYEFQGRDLVRVKDGKVFAPVSSADGVAKIDVLRPGAATASSYRWMWSTTTWVACRSSIMRTLRRPIVLFRGGQK